MPPVHLAPVHLSTWHLSTCGQVRDSSNSLADAALFLDHLVVNKLYLDLYLAP